VNLQQIRYLCAVVDHGLNVSTAAEALFTSQPGISKQIRQLEDELGVPIFIRQGKRLTALTAGGEVIVATARRALQELNNLKHVGAEFKAEDVGALAIATTHTQARYVLPPVLKRFANLHPRVDVAVRTGHSEEILAMVLNDEVQVGLVRTLRHPDILAVPLYEDELVLVCNPQHRFARRGAVELAEVGRERLVMFDRTSSYFELTQSLFLRGGVVAHTVMELDNIEAAKKMVEEGLGVALLPRVSVAREIGGGLLSEIEVVDAPPIRRSVDAIRRKDAGSPGGVVHAFLLELEATLRLRERRSVQLVV
jgi:LysR family cys regulon transcriptional activator